MRQGNEYADDDLVERVTAHRIYIVATCARPALACPRLPSPALARDGRPRVQPATLAPCHSQVRPGPEATTTKDPGGAPHLDQGAEVPG